MDKANRLSPEAPLFGLEPSPTPRFPDEPPAPSRDPPAEPPASAPVAAAPDCPAAPDLPVAVGPPDCPAAPDLPVAAAPATPTAPDLPVATEVAAPAPPPPSPPSSPPRLDVPDSAARALEACRSLAQAVVLRVGVPPRDAPDVVQKLLIALLPTWTERASWPPARQADYVAAAARIVARRYLWTAARRPETLAGGDTLRDLQEQAASRQPASPSPEELLLAHEAELEVLGDTLLLGEAQLPGLCTATAPAFWRVFYAYSEPSGRARGASRHSHEPSGRARGASRHAREPSGRARGASRHAHEPSRTAPLVSQVPEMPSLLDRARSPRPSDGSASLPRSLQNRPPRLPDRPGRFRSVPRSFDPWT